MLRVVPAILTAALFTSALGCHCERRQRAIEEREADPFEDFALPSVDHAGEADTSLVSLWTADDQVIMGSRRLARRDDDALDAAELERIQRAIRSASEGKAGIALGADRRARYGEVRSLLAAALAAEVEAVELLAGRRDSLRALEVCLHGPLTGALQGRGEDCWGRSASRPPAGAIDGGPASDGGSSIGAGDVVERPPAYDFEAPLELSLSIEPDYIAITIQGQILRSLLVPDGHGPGAESLQRALSQTLSSLRRSNGWERRAAVRIADEVAWGGALALIGTLAAARFDQVVITGVEAE